MSYEPVGRSWVTPYYSATEELAHYPASKSGRGPGIRVQETVIQSGIERHAQFAVVVIGQGNEAEGLKTRALKLARRVQHFGHAVDGARAGVESDFDEVSSRKFLLQLQQSAGDGNGLQFCARALATFGHHCGRDRSIELHSG